MKKVSNLVTIKNLVTIGFHNKKVTKNKNINGEASHEHC